MFKTQFGATSSEEWGVSATRNSTRNLRELQECVRYEPRVAVPFLG